MSRLALLVSRRVPLLVSLPIIVACGTAGFIASSMQPRVMSPGTPRIHGSAGTDQLPVATPAVEEPSRASETELSAQLTPPRDAPSDAVSSVDEMAPPPELATVPATSGHETQQVRRLVKPVQYPTPLSVKAPLQRTTRVVRPPRSQRAIQSRTIVRSTSATGLKSIPLVGPVFSLLQ
jgi:hypothetical protein